MQEVSGSIPLTSTNFLPSRFDIPVARESLPAGYSRDGFDDATRRALSSPASSRRRGAISLT
jgi:hypothetical protein